MLIYEYFEKFIDLVQKILRMYVCALTELSKSIIETYGCQNFRNKKF